MKDKVASRSLFEDLIGQRMAIGLLEAAILKNRIAPAYLFSGPNGVGRSLAALRFLEGIITGGYSSTKERRRLETLNHPDLLWVEPTYQHQGRLVRQSKAENEGVSKRSPPLIRLEQIREMSSFLGRKPVEAERGMVVIDAVEAMAEAASNALLKTLEEPGNGVLILLTTNTLGLLPTIRSRCQQILFSCLDLDDLQKVFLKNVEVDQNTLEKIFENSELFDLASGSPGALIKHFLTWENIPKELWGRLMVLPSRPMDALALARDITDSLDGEQQLWLIDWWQHYLWSQKIDSRPLNRLKKLRFHLLAFVQPRLAWEIALIEMISFNS